MVPENPAIAPLHLKNNSKEKDFDNDFDYRAAKESLLPVLECQQLQVCHRCFFVPLKTQS